MNTIRTSARHRQLMLRGQAIRVREWGESSAPRIFMLHGWGDCGSTFQFVVDRLQGDWHVIAPDWRGFGGSCSGAEAFWFADYFADLDALLREYADDDETVRLVGHSMGGNVACQYAGIRPARVAAVVALDAFGIAARAPEDAPHRLEKWLHQLATPPRGFRPYADVAELAARMQADNPRLQAWQAAFLAAESSTELADGSVQVAIDAAHRHVNPVPLGRAEVEACWRRAQARVCWLVQADPTWRQRLGIDDASYAAAQGCFAHFTEHALHDCGHNMHHDQPARVAALIEDFFAA